MNVADQLVDRLRKWGVECLFGYSGDGIDPILGALQRAGNSPRLITARHEESAALMATGYSKWTGGVGVCLATHGPGAIHLLNGLYDARLDRRPVGAIIAQQHRTVLGSGYQQEIDSATLFKDVCARFINTVSTAEQLPLALDKAMKTALATHSPTCVIIPHDVQQLPASDDPPPHSHGFVPTAITLGRGRVLPCEEDVDAAAKVLNEGERVAIIIGQGARGAAAEVKLIADVLHAGVAKALLGKPVLSDDLPCVTGLVGHLGTVASEFLMSQCDTLLMIGTNEPYTEFLPKPGQARAVQIDIDPRSLGMRYPTEVNLVGDAAETLRMLTARLATRDRSAWRERVTAAIDGWQDIIERRAYRHEAPVGAQLLVHELSARPPADAVLAGGGRPLPHWCRRAPSGPGGTAARPSRTLASMGSALPYAIAAKAAFPDRLVVALAGDGAMQMNGINELITVATMWSEWSDPRLPILVLDNGDLNEVSWEQRELEGDPLFSESQRVSSIPYADYARLLGLDGCKVDSADQVADAWDCALVAERPFVIHAVVDPAAPLLPPRLEEAAQKRMLAALEAEGTETARRAHEFVVDELHEQQELLSKLSMS